MLSTDSLRARSKVVTTTRLNLLLPKTNPPATDAKQLTSIQCLKIFRKNPLWAGVGELGLTQTQLSRQSGVPRTTINEILAGKRGISKVNAARLAKFFGLRIEEFIADAQRSSGI